MTNILDKLQKANYISTIDLDQAFHQVPLYEESKELTAFKHRDAVFSNLLGCLLDLPTPLRCSSV